jgi:hypothetical protein
LARGGDQVTGNSSQLIATVDRPSGGIWLIWADGGVWALDGAPFYGSYSTLHATEAMADACFIGAGHWPGGENGDGYYMVHRDVTPGGSGIYRFDADVWRRMQDT